MYILFLVMKTVNALIALGICVYIIGLSVIRPMLVRKKNWA